MSREWGPLTPRRRLHLLEGPERTNHLFLGSTPDSAPEAARGASSSHRGVAAAEHDHALADLGVWPNDTLESQSMPM